MKRKLKPGLLWMLFLFFTLLGCGQTIPKQDTSFKWDMAKGTKLYVHLDQHPYSKAIIQKLDDFEAKTGIKVYYTLTPEEYYVDKTINLLNSRTGKPDVFMSGPYYIWDLASKGLVKNLDDYMNHPDLLDPEYNIGDILPVVLNSMKWDLKPGSSVGSGPLWGLPLGFEVSSLTYNKNVFAKLNLQPPGTLDQLLNACPQLNGFNGGASYAMSLRGSNKWTTLTSSYITTFSNYGAKDFKVVNGKLVSDLNSKEAIAATKMWVELINKCTPPNWTSSPWYRAGADFGSGKTAILFDADNNAFFQNTEGTSSEAQNIAWSEAPHVNDQTGDYTNLWTWGLSINNSSTNPIASWLFLQYFTSEQFLMWGALEANVVDPARQSILNSPKFHHSVRNSDGYLDTLQKGLNKASVLFTPQPKFFETSTQWAITLQDIVLGKYKTVEEAMEKLKMKIDAMEIK
ncbi:ABC transporter substrate-binding protein [Paenibacillus elgii]|uniref:ABC transporter substrate-binding protein n=1 Tax=Paenibacillus elgii TaxID=189691 RepID=UPI00204032F5|nr:extracellular solute-binding protein [Paenibacillus elgii]MCM3270849.1 extracellular solute-binding protein [Paenibacillus elgii]